MRAENAVTAARVERFFQVSLLLLVANGFLAIAATGSLDGFSFTLMSAALVWRAVRVFRTGVQPIPSRIPSILALGYLGFYGIELYLAAPNILDIFVPATVRMMFFFTALKLLLARKGRDYLYLGLLAFLQLLAASMFLLSIGYAVVLLLFLALAITCYTSFEIKRGCESDVQLVEDYRRGRRKGLGVRLAALSVVLTAAILTLSAGLFLILPRTLGVSMGGLRAGYPVGFNDEVHLGVGGFLQPNDTPVMRVALLAGDTLDGLRWRGLALQHFDGVRWSNPDSKRKEVDPEKRRLRFAGDSAAGAGRAKDRIRGDARAPARRRTVSSRADRDSQRLVFAADCEPDRLALCRSTQPAAPCVTRSRLGSPTAAPINRPTWWSCFLPISAGTTCSFPK